LRFLKVQFRLFSWIFCLALMAALAPRTAAAQSSPQAGSPAQPAAAPQKEAPKTQQEEDDVYRHAPKVQQIARILFQDRGASAGVREEHDEITARVFEGINFAIIFLAIGIPLVRIVPKTIRARGEKVRNDIESARKVTEDANARLSAVESKLSKLDEEIAKFRAEIEQDILQDEKRIKATIEEESTRIVASVEQEIGVAAAQARRVLRNLAADLAIESASKQLVLTAETDNALIAEFVSDMAGRGGQN